LSKIPYIVTAMIAGALAESGQFSLFYWGVILFLIGIVVSVTIAYRVYRKPLTHPTTSPMP
ncbi:MAG TPA: hypothetical protein PLZ51_06210, partial [Aggregatilineales bacterium]|nr:hypothetical protein [Aggregatilineales bacterium]